MFNESFKYYKSKCPPPSFESVIDFNEVDQNISDTNNEEFNYFGLVNPNQWQIYQLPSGLIFVKNPFTPQGQRYWIARCLRDYPKSPHVTNLRSHKSIPPAVCNDWWTGMVNSKSETEKGRLKTTLRWCTLGYHHQWDTKVYVEEMRHSFPMDLGGLSAYVADALGFERYSAQAAIANFYPIGTTLSGHTDHSERNLDAPLFSYSFGQTAIFLIGGTTRDIKPSALFLRSGDIVVMSEESRLCYHAVPRVFKSNSSPWEMDDDTNASFSNRQAFVKLNSELWNEVRDRLFWEPFKEYILNCRININVRQVLKEGEYSLLNVGFMYGCVRFFEFSIGEA